MQRMKTWMASAFAALLLALPVHAANDIVIGQVAPLSGVLATTGAQMVLGGKIYFDEINAQGGVNGAKDVEFDAMLAQVPPTLQHA